MERLKSELESNKDTAMTNNGDKITYKWVAGISMSVVFSFFTLWACWVTTTLLRVDSNTVQIIEHVNPQPAKKDNSELQGRH